MFVDYCVGIGLQVCCFRSRCFVGSFVAHVIVFCLCCFYLCGFTAMLFVVGWLLFVWLDLLVLLILAVLLNGFGLILCLLFWCVNMVWLH